MITIKGGESWKNRISFYSNKYYVTAIREEDGEISTKITNMHDFLNNIKMNDIKKQAFAVNFLSNIYVNIILLSIVKHFFIIPLIEKHIISSVFYLVIAFVCMIILVCLILIIRHKGGIEYLRNHGAEHKTFTAYNELERIPSIEELKHYSRIHKSCGATIYSAFIISQLVGYLVYLIFNFMISEILLFSIPIIFHAYPPFNILGRLAQYYTTAEPKNDNIELALKALETLVSQENL